MATEVDHPAIHQEVKEEIHETKATDLVKDSPIPNVPETPCVTEEEKKSEPATVEQIEEAPTPELPAVETTPIPNVQETPCVTKEEKKSEPAPVEQVEEAPTPELPAVETKEKETKTAKAEIEETLKSEVMALDNETIAPAKEQKTETKTDTVEEVKPIITEVPSVESKEDKTEIPVVVEDVIIEKEPQAETLTEKIENESVQIPPTKEVVNETKEEIVEAVAEIAQNKEDEPCVVEEKKEDVPLVEEKQSVPLDEIAVIEKQAETGEKKEDVPLVEDKQSVPLDEIAVIEKHAETTGEKREKEADAVEEKPMVPLDESAIITQQIETEEKKEECAKETVEEKPILTEQIGKEDVKKEQEKTVEAKENGAVNETTDPEKPTLEPVKTESETVNETKSKETTPKEEEEKTTPKQSNSLMGKVKKSFIKAKKAIFIGKNTTTNNKTPESKEDVKA